MKTFFKSIPVPMCGLTLAILSLGNLLIGDKLSIIGNIIGTIGVILMLLILSKIIFVFDHTKTELKNAVVASTAPTFSMGVMVLCTYLVRWFPHSSVAFYIWIVSIIIQFGLMIYFTSRFVILTEVQMNHIYPSWFVVYCGLGIVPITSGHFSPIIGQIIFWIALGFYFILLPIVIYRIFIHKNFQKHELPLITILAAPGSLCLTGYLAAFPHPHITLVTTLLIISQLLYIAIIISLPTLLKGSFYPSYAAFTFPLVICATAVTKCYNFYMNYQYTVSWMGILAVIETIIASVIVCYVLFKYVEHIIQANMKQQPPKTDMNQIIDC